MPDQVYRLPPLPPTSTETDDWMFGCSEAWEGLGGLGNLCSEDGGGLGGCLRATVNNYVKAKRTIRATGECAVGTQITKCHVCAHRRRCHFTMQGFCEDTALARMPAPLTKDF